MAPPPIQRWPAERRFHTETERTSTHHCFSFGAHYDPDNVSFGRLLVLNDDVVAPGPGYDPHTHTDAEIVTWVLSGSLVHEDAGGHRTVVARGSAQRMSAGAGTEHAERNDAYRDDPARPAVPVRFVQMWLRPDHLGGPPSYEQRAYDPAALTRGWLAVASGAGDAVLGLGSSGCTLWVSVLPAGVSRVVPGGAFVHLYLARGAVAVNGGAGDGLVAGDSLRLRGSTDLMITAEVESEVLVWEMSA